MVTARRTYSRIVLVGFWSLLFGGVLVVVIAQFFSMMASASPNAQKSDVGVPVQGLVQQSLLPLLSAGVASVGVGLLLLVLGIVLLRSMVGGGGGRRFESSPTPRSRP